MSILNHPDGDGPEPHPLVSSLSGADRETIARAREALGGSPAYDLAGMAARIGALEWHLGEVLRLAERLGE